MAPRPADIQPKEGDLFVKDNITCSWEWMQLGIRMLGRQDTGESSQEIDRQRYWGFSLLKLSDSWVSRTPFVPLVPSPAYPYPRILSTHHV